MYNLLTNEEKTRNMVIQKDTDNSMVGASKQGILKENDNGKNTYTPNQGKNNSNS